MQRDAAIAEMTLDEWNAVIDVNLTGQFLCVREAIRRFDAQGAARRTRAAVGKIICMSSVHDVIPWAGHVNYAASKGGVELLMRSVAQEVAPRRIRVNCDLARRDRAPTINQDAWETEEQRRQLLKLIPYGRIGEPDDVAQAAVWLASDASDYVTGTTIYVDGGMTLYPGFEAMAEAAADGAPLSRCNRRPSTGRGCCRERVPACAGCTMICRRSAHPITFASQP